MFVFLKVMSSPRHKVSDLSRFRVAHNNDWHEVQSQDQKIVASIQAKSTYPGTYCHMLGGDNSVVLGYGATQPNAQDEFLHINITTDGNVTIERDVRCTLPIFYGLSEGVFVMSNAYEEVCRSLPVLTLDTSAVITELTNPPIQRPISIWQEVGVLIERETLTLRRGKLTKTTPPPRAWRYNTDLTTSNPSQPRDFPAMLEARFTNFAERFVYPNKVGFEISGGLDSSMLPLVMAAKGYNLPLTGASNILPGGGQVFQLAKLADLERATYLCTKRIFANPACDYPLAPMIQSGKYRPFYTVRELYEKTSIDIAEYFIEQEIDVVIGGGGGDQLLENIPDPNNMTTPEHTATQQLPDFLTSECKRLADLDESSTPPSTLLPSTITLGNLAGSNIYIERGIWPISPFHDVQFFNFCQALPVQFRANKNIYRAYFEAHQFPESLYRGPNESFEQFFRDSLLSDHYARVIKHFAQHSLLDKLGFVDSELLWNEYNGLRKGIHSNTLFLIYKWLVLEINLHTTDRWRS